MSTPKISGKSAFAKARQTAVSFFQERKFPKRKFVQFRHTPECVHNSRLQADAGSETIVLPKTPNAADGKNLSATSAVNIWMNDERHMLG